MWRDDRVHDDLTVSRCRPTPWSCTTWLTTAADNRADIWDRDPAFIRRYGILWWHTAVNLHPIYNTTCLSDEASITIPDWPPEFIGQSPSTNSFWSILRIYSTVQSQVNHKSLLVVTHNKSPNSRLWCELGEGWPLCATSRTDRSPIIGVADLPLDHWPLWNVRCSPALAIVIISHHYCRAVALWGRRPV